MSEPGLSRDAVFKMTKVKPELIIDADMYILFEKGTRGGVSCISNRYSKAKNKYFHSYNLKQESSHVIYLDVNNLNDYAMSKFLPINEFKWINPKEIDLNKYTSISSKGCVLEVDLEC